jgi:hypothetical protein
MNWRKLRKNFQHEGLKLRMIPFIKRIFSTYIVSWEFEELFKIIEEVSKEKLSVNSNLYLYRQLIEDFIVFFCFDSLIDIICPFVFKVIVNIIL